MTRVSRLFRNLNYRRIAQLFLLPNLAFVLVAQLVDPAKLIIGFNAALVALATGVVISYLFDAVTTVVSHKPMTKVHWLVLGITTHWAGTDGQRMFSIAWRWLGQPMEMVNSYFIAYCLFASTAGAYFHLVASEALGEDRIPRKQWVRYGVLVAAAILTALAVGYVIESYSEAGLLSQAFG